MSHREEEVQEERKRIFYDTASDLFYIKYVSEHDLVELSESQISRNKKKRKVETPSLELMSKLNLNTNIEVRKNW